MDEALPPGKNYDTNLDLQAMRDMRQVLENRLKDPSQYNARGATNETQIITAHGQFQGFGNCPKGIPHYADDDVKAANNPTHALRAEYYQHVQNAITAATESITPTVAGLPNATAWYAAGKGKPKGDFYPLQDVERNTFYGTGSGPGDGKSPVERARHLAKQTRADAAKRHITAYDKLHHMLMKSNPQIPSVAPPPGRAGHRQGAMQPRAGVGETTGLSGTSRPPGTAASLTTGAAAGQGTALTGHRKIIADAYAQAAQTKALRDAARAAMSLQPLGGICPVDPSRRLAVWAQPGASPVMPRPMGRSIKAN